MFLLRARMAVVSSVRARVCACVNRPSWLFSACVRHPSAQALAYTTHCVYPLRVSVHHPSSQVHVRASPCEYMCAHRRRHRISACVYTVLCVCVGLYTCVNGDVRKATYLRRHRHARPSHCSSSCQTLRLQSVFAKRWYATTRAAPERRGLL